MALLRTPLYLLPLAYIARASPDTVTITAAPSIPSTAPQFVSDDHFTSAVLNSTNFFRTQHNASWIEWNSTIAGYASDYLSDNDDCAFEHSGGPYGENLAKGCSDVTTCVDMWGNERKDYNYDEGEFGEETGHFTQLVWKNTSSVGCGRRLCGPSGWYLVCEYWPRGNVIGQFVDQVGKQTNGTESGNGGGGGSGGGISVVKPSLCVTLLVALVLGLWNW